MIPDGMIIGNLYGGILGSPIANKNDDNDFLLLIRMLIWMSYYT